MLFFPSCMQYKDPCIFHLTNGNENNRKDFCLDMDLSNQNLIVYLLNVNLLLPTLVHYFFFKTYNFSFKSWNSKFGHANICGFYTLI